MNRKRIALLLIVALLVTMLLPGTALAARKKKKKAEVVYKLPEFEHSYQLQPDSHESTDTEPGLRHYICADCGDEYSYETAPLVYETNPKTGAPVDQAGAYNPLLPSWEHIPDGEPQVFWSKEDGEWRVYLYGSHDDTGVGYCGFNYILYSAPVYDLSDWRSEGVILDISENATSGATVGLFAPDCAYDLTADRYYFISNEFNAYSVLRVADSPAGPFVEDEAIWKVSVKGCYDPSIYIENGTIYVAGSCMKNYYCDYDIDATVQADGYSSGMSHIGVIYQLKTDPTDGDGIEAISWMPNEARDYLPIYEGPSLLGWVDELGCYVYLYVSNDYDADGTWYNSAIGWAWTDDIMNGTWHFGENGVEENYTDPGMVISGNHGNIVSDTSGRYSIDPATGELAFREFATYTHGNNHGGMAKINGKWYFFGHRHSGAHSSSRQAIAGELNLHMDGDAPVIEPMELTSSGVAGSMSAYEQIAANRVCYLIEAIDHPAPSVENDNTHSECLANTPYVLANRDEAATHAVPIVNLKNGNVAGFKYLDFGEAESPVSLKLLVAPGDVSGSVDVWLDAPSADQGGTQIGSAAISTDAISSTTETDTATDGTVWSWISGDMDAPVSGIHGVYFVFAGDGDGMICNLDAFAFATEE